MGRTCSTNKKMNAFKFFKKETTRKTKSLVGWVIFRFS
jgi:hypothetical protein